MKNKITQSFQLLAAEPDISSVWPGIVMAAKEEHLAVKRTEIIDALTNGVRSLREAQRRKLK